MRTVSWVRHAPTHEKAFVGWRDVAADLTDHDQIARLSAFLPINAVVVASDLLRARSTADAICAARTRLPDDPGLREFNFGHWDGMTFDAVAARDPDLSRRYWEEPGDLRAPGGESWNDVADRVSNVVEQLTTEHAGDLIIVAHIGVIMTQIARAGGSPYQAMGYKIDNLSVTQLRIDATGWHQGCINHLP